MWEVSFEEWLAILHRCAARHGVELTGSDDDHRVFYDNDNTPYGAVMLIDEFGY